MRQWKQNWIEHKREIGAVDESIQRLGERLEVSGRPHRQSACWSRYVLSCCVFQTAFVDKEQVNEAQVTYKITILALN
jgi:hypothetical protein